MTTGTLNNMDESLKLSAEWKKPCIKSIGKGSCAYCLG